LPRGKGRGPRNKDTSNLPLTLMGLVKEHFCGHPVIPASQLEESGFDRIIITDIEHRQIIHDELIAAGIPARKIELP